MPTNALNLWTGLRMGNQPHSSAGCDSRTYSRRKGVVDFPNIDVGIRQAMAHEQARDRKGRGHKQTLRPQIDRGDLPIDELGFMGVSRQFGETGLRGQPISVTKCRRSHLWRHRQLRTEAPVSPFDNKASQELTSPTLGW
jgi:hypothetical protein